MNGLNRRKVTSLWCSGKGVQLLFKSSHFSKIKGKVGTPSTSSPHHLPLQISLCTPYPHCPLAVSGKVTHIRVNTRSPNHTLRPISAHPFGALLLLPIPSFFFPSFLYLRHLLLPGPFPFCFSVDPGPTMLAKQTIKIKPLLNSIHSFPPFLPPSHSFENSCFFSRGLHSWPPLAQSHLLRAHCNLAFLLPLHWDSSCQVHQQLPRSTGHLSVFSLFDYCSISLNLFLLEIPSFLGLHAAAPPQFPFHRSAQRSRFRSQAPLPK